MTGCAAREKVCCCVSCDLEFRPQCDPLVCPECGSEEIVIKDLYEGVNYTVRELVASKSAENYIKSRDGRLTIGRTRVKIGSSQEGALIRLRIREESPIGYANFVRVQSYLIGKDVQLVEEAAYRHGGRIMINRYPSGEKVGP